jgi:hypothetical protein
VHVATPGQVPKTSSGKVQRDRCRASLLDGSLDILGSHSSAAGGSHGHADSSAGGRA